MRLEKLARAVGLEQRRGEADGAAAGAWRSRSRVVGERDDRHGAARAEGADELRGNDAVHVGDGKVEHDQVDAGRPGEGAPAPPRRFPAPTPAQPNCSASIRVTIALVALPSTTATRGRRPSAVLRKGGSLRIAALAIGPESDDYPRLCLTSA